MLRKSVNKKVDQKVFRKTASIARMKSKNIPGRVVSRGGIRL